MVLRQLRAFVQRLVSDESGGEVIEYVLIAGLIVLAAITIVTAVGTKVAARWESVNSSV